MIWKSDLYSNLSTEPVSMLDSSKNNSFTPSLNIYYQHSLNKNEVLILNLSGLYKTGNYSRYYKESRMGQVFTDLTSLTDEAQYSGGISFLYENRMKVGTLNIGLNEKYTSTRDNYNNTIGTSDYLNKSTLGINDLYMYAQFGKLIKKWYLQAGIGTTQSFQDANSNRKNYLFFRPSLTLTYTPKENLEFIYNGSVYPTSPSLAALTKFDQRIDSLQIQRGNPALKPQTSYYNAISIDYSYKIFGLSYYINHTYVTFPLMERSFLENEMVVRTIENQKQFQKINTEVELRAKPIKDYLNVQIYSGIKYYISNGNTYNHMKSIPYFGGRISIYYKKLSLSWLISQNTSDSFWGESLFRDESAHVVSLSYNTQNYYIGLECFNMFSTKHTASKENFNAMAPYVRYEFMDELRNMVRFKLTHTLRYGKEYNSNYRKIRSYEEVESGIQKGEK